MELRAAIAQAEFVLHYQPKVALVSGELQGVEALVRWRHPRLGLIPPAEFVPVAEEAGLICALGDWVLEQACRQSRAWRKRGLDGVRIAVNVSAQQLRHGDLYARIEGLTQTYGIPPRDLEIELIESSLMAQPGHVIAVLGRLRKLGVSVAVGGFGSGDAGLATLRRLPIDVLKIDRSLVTKIDRDDGDAQVVRAIMALAGALDFAVVAEGVETEGQAAALRACGCTTAQGYLYARPAPAAKLEAWLGRQAVTTRSDNPPPPP